MGPLPYRAMLLRAWQPPVAVKPSRYVAVPLRSGGSLPMAPSRRGSFRHQPIVKFHTSPSAGISRWRPPARC